MKPASATEMQSLAHGATAGRSTVSTGTQPADAWRREMERVQAEAWFKGQLPQRHAGFQGSTAAPQAGTKEGPSLPITDMPDRGRVPPAPLAESSNGAPAATRSEPVKLAVSDGKTAASSVAALTMARASDSGMARQQPEATQVTAKQRPAVQTVALRTTPAHALTDAAPGNVHTHEAKSVVQDATPLAASHKPAPPVRVHIETAGGDATVWLGVDGTGLALVPQVVRDIASRLANLGYGAPRWVCNGQPYAEAPAAAPQRRDETERAPALPIYSGRHT